MIDPWYLDHLVCPVDKGALERNGDWLVSAAGRRYPVVDGMPVMLVPDVKQTLGVARRSLRRAREGAADARARGYYLESLAVSLDQRNELLALVAEGKTAIDPVAVMLQRQTAGNGYRHLVGSRDLSDYPIPRIALARGEGQRLLDIGCNWGRWSFSAARVGYHVTGIDPSLGSVMAARRIAAQLGLDARFVVADGRYLPFREQTFDTVYSYSVLQHLSETDASLVLGECARVLVRGGTAKIQMAARWGVRSLQQQAKRGFRAPDGFEVRYYSVPALRRMFERHIGPTQVAVDCYLGLGWQWSDYRFMRPCYRPILIASEALRRASEVLPPMRWMADSIFCTATRN